MNQLRAPTPLTSTALALALLALGCSADDAAEGDEIASADDPSTDTGDDDPSTDTGSDSGGPPCGGDILGCDDTPTPFEEDPSCELSGELELALGDGELGFEALAPDTLPALHLGQQGAQHMWVGVEVQNPAVDYSQLEILVELRGCPYQNVSCTDASNWVTYPERRLVVDEDSITVTPEGEFQVTQILYVVAGWDWTVPERWVFRVTVNDPCGRTGQITVNTVTV